MYGNGLLMAQIKKEFCGVDHSLMSPSSAEESDRITYFSVSLGRRMSRAKFSLPHPYHVQNLLRSIVDRLKPERDAGAKKAEGKVSLKSRAVLVGPESG